MTAWLQGVETKALPVLCVFGIGVSECLSSAAAAIEVLRPSSAHRHSVASYTALSDMPHTHEHHAQEPQAHLTLVEPVVLLPEGLTR